MKKLFFLCLVYLQNLLAVEPVYISLGSTCTSAFRLTIWNLRSASYPFDWIISPFDALYATLEDDFREFFNDLVLDSLGTTTRDHYGLDFHHVWQEHFPGVVQLDLVDWESKIPLIKEKQQRRIERFRSACNSKETIVFVRYDHIDKEGAQRLRDLIKSKYPQLVFILMVVKDSEDFQEPWNLEQIKNFSAVHSDVYRWRDLFKQVSASLDYHAEIKADDGTKYADEIIDTLIPDGLVQ